MKKGFIEQIEEGWVTIFWEDGTKSGVQEKMFSEVAKEDDIVQEENKTIKVIEKDPFFNQKIKKLFQKTSKPFSNHQTKPLRIGIIGPGNIATTVCKALQENPEFQMEAVASRVKEKAEAFQRKFGFRKAYGSYLELYQDSEVDLVYIATPHAFHYEQMKEALSYRKAVLCEKAFCLHVDEVKEIIKIAQEEHLFVGEAMVPAFLPSRKLITSIIQSGQIGTIQHAKAVFGAKLDHVPRVVQKELGGGALYDIGIYPLYFFLQQFKMNPTLKDITIKWKNEVDIANYFVLQYPTFEAVVESSVEEDLGIAATLTGSKAILEIENIARPEQIILKDFNGTIIQKWDNLRATTGYEYEFLAAKQAIMQGKIETKGMMHKDTIALYTWIEQILSI